MQSNRRVLIVVAALVIVGGLVFALVNSQPTSAAKGVTWRYDFSAASKEAAKAKKPMMVDFYADWCGWCKKLDSEVYSNARVVDASRRFVSVKLDTDRDPNTARKYGVEGLPTIVFIRPNGKEISRVVGYRPVDDFLKEMNKAVDSAKK